MRPQAFKAFKRLRNNTGRDSFRITNTASDETEIWLYGEIGGWWGISAEEFADQLKAITTPKIAVRISSPGGSVFDAITIHSCLKNHPATVTTYVDGLAASAASFVALAGDKVVTSRNAMWMIHDASTIMWGNSTEMRECADLLDKVSDNIADFYAEKAGGTVADWRARMSEETWYTGAEAVEQGLADEVASGKSNARQQVPDSDSGESDDDYWDLAAMFKYAGRDKAPAPKMVDRSRTESRAPDTISDEALSWLRAQTPRSITVTTTGPASVSVSYGDDAPVVEQAEATPVEAEPVADEPGDVEPEVSPAVEAAVEPTEATEQDEPTTSEPAADEKPAEQPATDGEPATDADHTPAGPPPPATTEPEPTDEWAAAVAGLTKPESIEDAIARLRGA